MRLIAAVIILAAISSAQTSGSKPATSTAPSKGHMTVDVQRQPSTLPSEETVRSFLKQTFGYDPNVSYEVLSIGPSEMPGRSCFLQADGRVFHTYSQYARGLESTGGSYYFLDLTALGRQEDWEQPAGRADAVRGAVPDFAS